MVNSQMTTLDDQINKIYDVIKAFDNDYNIQTYTKELEILIGKFSFNIMPLNILTREFTGIQTLPNLGIHIFFHYDMKAEDSYKNAWTALMTKANAILDALYDKTNFISGVSTVKIDTSFDNNDIQKERMVDLTFECEYKIFATR